jgi:alpha-D-ribose 1-methylphosphonate 5-triphosphate synthase subunit PhnH
LHGGFADPARDAAFAFRAIMEAMARPGTQQPIAGAMPPAPLSPAAGAALLTLCDTDTPVCLAGAADCTEVRAWIAFHTGAPFAERKDCMFAVGTWDALLPLADYPLGTPEYPDRSATLIVETPALSGAGARLRGPGIREVATLPLPEVEAFRLNGARFPLGLDFLFTCGDRIAALPRSATVEDPRSSSEAVAHEDQRSSSEAIAHEDQRSSSEAIAHNKGAA